MLLRNFSWAGVMIVIKHAQFLKVNFAQKSENEIYLAVLEGVEFKG